MSGFKRIRQPKMTTQALLSFDDLGESSSDSDFRIEDHCSDGSKDEDYDRDSDSDSENGSSSSEDDSAASGESEGNESEDSTLQLKKMLSEGLDDERSNDIVENLEAIHNESEVKKIEKPKISLKPICCVCLGGRSDDSNEIVECDGCGVSVHELCYGVSDNQSISSTNSTCSTEPWFCEACKAGVTDPICELCPNSGGIFKETDVGKWVHLVCALYVPGVAFGEVDQLSSVTLFEMQYSKWGAKMCSLCEDSRYARCGVAIGCDAGMCKTFFHVTCAQAAGFLTEAHHEDADAADPFYAHCKVHSEKEMIRKRKRNYNTFRVYMQEKMKEKAQLKCDDPTPDQIRIQRKLSKSQHKYSLHKQHKAQPWVPTQKMSRLLTTSASACKRLFTKADLMEVDVELLERQEQQISALQDIRKKWHVPPAFSVEFFGYYIDRISRMKEIKQNLAEMVESNKALTEEQGTLRGSYDTHLDINRQLKNQNESMSAAINRLHNQILSLCPSKQFPDPVNIGKNQTDATKCQPAVRPISVPTAAALKMGVGFPLAHLGPPGTKIDSSRLLSTHANNNPPSNMLIGSTSTSTSLSPLGFGNALNLECGTCKRDEDQHLLVKCDTCKLHYHLGCLNPPLSRHPVKSKTYGWQCSECDKSDESDTLSEMPKGPRKARTRFNKDGSIIAMEKVLEESKQLEQAKKRSLEMANLNACLPKKKRSLSNFLHSDQSTSPSPINKNKIRAITPGPNETKLPKISSTSTPTSSNSSIRATTPTQFNSINKINKFITANNVSKALQGTTSSSVSEEAIGINAANIYDPLEIIVPKISAQESFADPLAIVAVNCHSNDSLDSTLNSTKQSRKQKRKEKHKYKHSPCSDTEKSPNKEHKRKRKKKEQESDVPNDTVRKIKIKFKTLPLPGEPTPETKFFYVSADTVHSDEEEISRSPSVETIEDVQPAISLPPPNPPTDNDNTFEQNERTKPLIQATPTVSLTRKSSPRKNQMNLPYNSLLLRNPPTKSTHMTPTIPTIPTTANTYSVTPTPPQMKPALSCIVCNTMAMPLNTVTCDECHQAYHFACLDPPVKKTPKIRGYSWICAECDVTEEEISNK